MQLCSGSYKAGVYLAAAFDEGAKPMTQLRDNNHLKYSTPPPLYCHHLKVTPDT